MARLIAFSTQIIAEEKAMEDWCKFPLDRQRLFDVIAESDSKGFVLFSGNVHFTEICASAEGPYRLYDITASGMTPGTPEYAEGGAMVLEKHYK